MDNYECMHSRTSKNNIVDRLRTSKNKYFSLSYVRDFYLNIVK